MLYAEQERIFDVEYRRNGMRYRHNSFTAGLYSTKAMTCHFISIIGRKIKYFKYFLGKLFSKISRKAVRRWKRLAEQNSDHFLERKYLINFLIYRRKCYMPSRNESLTSNIAETE